MSKEELKKSDLESIEIQLDTLLESFDTIEKSVKKQKQPIDHSEQIQSLRSDLKAFKQSIQENLSQAPELDLSSLESKYDALAEQMSKLERSARHMQWLFPDVRAFFSSIGTWWSIITIGLIIGLAWACMHYSNLSEKYEPAYYKMQLATRAEQLYTIKEADSMWQHHKKEIIHKIDSAISAEKAEIEAKKEDLERELEEK